MKVLRESRERGMATSASALAQTSRIAHHPATHASDDDKED
jgi:hypothetical protein